MNAVKVLALPILAVCSLQTSADAFLPTSVTSIAKVIRWALVWSDFVKTADVKISEIEKKYVEVHEMRSSQSCKRSPQPIDVFVSEIAPALFALSNQLSDIEAKFHDSIDHFHKVIEELELDIEEHRSMMNLQEVMDSISQTFDNLLTHLQIAEESDSVALRNKACDNTSRHSLQNKVNKLRNDLDPKKSRLKTAVEVIVQKLKTEPSKFCGAGQSSYEYLHSIYASVVLAEVRAHAVQVFYLNLLYKYQGNQNNCAFDEDNSDIQVKILLDSLKRHLKTYIGTFSDAMQKVSRDHRACDEGRLLQDETYIELTGAVQTVIQFLELPDVSGVYYKIEDHDNLCKYFDLSSSPYACLEELPWCLADLKKPCLGDVSKCNAIRDAKICLTTDDSRRFQWIKSHMTYKNVKNLTCAGTQLELTDHVCLCLCHDYEIDSISRHLFNLQPVESDTAENKIVTGVKFMVKNDVMQFQIQQGTLGVHWSVSDVKWKQVDDISEQIRFARLGSKLRGKIPDLVEYRDFLIVDTLVGTEISLNRLTVPHGYVLTGVQFVAQRPSADTPKRIHIALTATKFDYETGQLLDEETIIRDYTRHNDELIYNTQNVNTPVTPLIKASNFKQFVTIKPSDWRSVDSGQTTLPYFDGKSVETKPPSLIGGVELCYKTKEQFTGMLSLVLISLDYVKYMNDSLYS